MVQDSSILIHTSCIFSLKFCGAHVVTHFFCDGPPILSLSCVSTSLCEILIFIFAGFNLLSCTLTILVSYLFILFTILRMNSTQGRFKAFSTCASHLSTVCLFYGTLFMYLRPKSSYSLVQITELQWSTWWWSQCWTPLLLVEKQGCEGSFKKGLEQENNGTVSTRYHISLGSRGNLTLCGANLSTFPSCPGSSGHALWSRCRCFCISLPACCRKSWWCHRNEKEVIFFSDYSFIYPCSWTLHSIVRNWHLWSSW